MSGGDNQRNARGCAFPPSPVSPAASTAPAPPDPPPPPPLPPSAPRRGACAASVARFLPRAAGPHCRDRATDRHVANAPPLLGQTCRERSPSAPSASAGRHRADRRSPDLRPPADTESDTAIPLPNVESPILSKVIEYCTWHVKAEQDRTAEDTRNEWNSKFVDVDQGTLFHLILVRTSPRVLRRLYERSAPPSLHLNARQAANYLNIKSLLDLTCKTVADMIKGKTPEEIRAHFNIQNDFTPEEEEEVR
eukprot:COSAG01_NODE_1551_length_9933_cov_19.737848_9_plen_250_part_00